MPAWDTLKRNHDVRTDPLQLESCLEIQPQKLFIENGGRSKGFLQNQTVISVPTEECMKLRPNAWLVLSKDYEAKPENWETRVVGRLTWWAYRDRARAAAEDMGEMEGEDLKLIRRELVLVQQYVVVSWPACSLNARVRQQEEVILCHMSHSIVQHCKKYNVLVIKLWLFLCKHCSRQFLGTGMTCVSNDTTVIFQTLHSFKS